MNGLELCRRIRERESIHAFYLIFLTTNESKAHVVQGLQAGADDYLVKPCDPEELHARIRVGERVVKLQTELAQRVVDLEEAMQRIKHLQGIIRICSYCKKIRDDQASCPGRSWNPISPIMRMPSSAMASVRSATNRSLSRRWMRR